MTNEQLVEIERRFLTRVGVHKFQTIFDRDMEDLIAEVRRLKRIIGYIESEHARATGLHTDGTATYSLRGIVGEGTSIEDAVSRKCRI